MTRAAQDYPAWAADDVLPARQPWLYTFEQIARHQNDLLYHMMSVALSASFAGGLPTPPPYGLNDQVEHR